MPRGVEELPGVHQEAEADGEMGLKKGGETRGDGLEDPDPGLCEAAGRLGVGNLEDRASADRPLRSDGP